MDSELETLKRMKLGLPVPGVKILERRTKGLSAIRQEFRAQLFQLAGYRMESSLIVRWRGLGDLANSRTVVDDAFELVMRSGLTTITGKFPDIWVLCYPEDLEIKGKVEAELQRMCEAVRHR